MRSNILDKIESLPNTPGIYKFLDRDNNILYIGKAIALKKRVKSYFKNDLNDRPRVLQMIPLITDVEVVETNNEIEALVLESALVKKYKPKYNTDLKDDKSYAWIYINTRDDIPTVKIVRSLKKGEYRNGRVFGPYPSGYTVKRVYSYLRNLYPFCTCKNRDCKSSLYFHIGLCPGPYAGKISKGEYRDNINNIIKFLSGSKKNHIKALEKMMAHYSSNQEYEKASEVRDRIKDLKYIGQDIEFTYYDDDQLYVSNRNRARINSFKYLSIELGIKKLTRIECYDISNLQGTNAYGSMVVAEDGAIERSKYRVFKIRGEDKPNDYEMLKEVLIRRFKGDEIHPQLLLIDGGKGQLSYVSPYIPSDILIVGISKGKHLKRKGKRLLDEFWIYREGNIFQINLESPELLIDLRNEAHRFAISHYRKQKIKSVKRSILDDIDGVGSKRKKLLLSKYNSVEDISNATIEDIYMIVKNRKVAKNIKDTLLIGRT